MPFWLPLLLGIAARVLLSMCGGILLKHGIDANSWQEKAASFAPAVASGLWAFWASLKNRKRNRREASEAERIRHETQDDP